jgi:hypothetical protein
MHGKANVCNGNTFFLTFTFFSSIGWSVLLWTHFLSVLIFMGKHGNMKYFVIL